MLERYAVKVARTVLRGGSGSNATPPSERHLEIGKNASFSSKIATFHIIFMYATRRSLVENDRLPSFQGAPRPCGRYKTTGAGLRRGRPHAVGRLN
jgi:hypothetical protein